jgi:hypothetical protein
MNRILHRRTKPILIVLLALIVTSFTVNAAWEKVPPMIWTGIAPSAFADHEFDVPYHLEHFASVVNAVVEEGDNRGFIDIPVNRKLQDNKPYNARILENHAWIAYFYTTKKPWNPYYAMPAVRQRLEAVLDFWCRIPSPRGHFSESGPEIWNLAATGFGVLFMSRTLDHLLAADAPPFDRAILERTIQTQRKAILAIFNDEMPRRTAKSYHNQYTGVYRAAIRYMQLRPDPDMQSAMLAHGKWADENTQSPAGFFYEANHPDFGYTKVYESNLLNTEPVLAQATAAIRQKLIEEYRRYNLWQAANFLLEPDRSGYFLNAGIQNRTNHSSQKYSVRPLAREVEESWPFSVTDAEFAVQIREKRTALEKEWPKLPPLTGYSARDSFFATDGLPGGFPSAAQRDAAIAKLPYLARKSYVQLRFDPRGIGFLYVRRPTYYAALNFGVSEGRSHPVLGLGLLWNDNAGTVAQTLPTPENAVWGTRLNGEASFVESRTITPTFVVGGEGVRTEPGVTELADKPVLVTWLLRDAGTKTVTFEGEEIRVRITLTPDTNQSVLEQIPLVLRHGDTLRQEGNQIFRTRGDQSLVITVEDGQIQPLPAPGKTAAVYRLNVHITGKARLVYSLKFARR